ncbi:MAG: YsnF/AvaK domain-containing protein [Geminicoccaceae bacterium]|nr:YsnF/AvaK domain-containing protein [Geminicoccaceae bacterium]
MDAIPLRSGKETIGSVSRSSWYASDAESVEVILRQGQVLQVPRHMLIEEGEALQLAPDAMSDTLSTTGADSDARIVPVLAEQVQVGRRTVVKGGVRLKKTVEGRVEEVDLDRVLTEAHVERRPVGRIVAEPPATREEDGNLIIPVLEETYVVEKRLILKEEIVVRLDRTRKVETVQVPLRREAVEVERLAAEDVKQPTE